MIAVLQRVTSSSVSVGGKVIGSIGHGLNILLGVLREDSKEDIEKAVQKIMHLRIFADEEGKMNRSLIDVGGEMLVISQFTLGANVKKGRRPSFEGAASPDEAERLYDYFIAEASKDCSVQSGEFGANMQVEIHNDGPVTIMINSREL